MYDKVLDVQLLEWMFAGLHVPSYVQAQQKEEQNNCEAMVNENWISDLMHNITTPLLAEFMMLWLMVDAFYFNPSDQDADAIVWIKTANGEYLTKSAYGIQFDGSLASIFPTRVWQVWAPLSYKIFIRLMLQNHIWRADRLLLR
jgi:hypothetical protein